MKNESAKTPKESAPDDLDARIAAGVAKALNGSEAGSTWAEFGSGGRKNSVEVTRDNIDALWLEAETRGANPNPYEEQYRKIIRGVGR